MILDTKLGAKVSRQELTLLQVDVDLIAEWPKKARTRATITIYVDSFALRTDYRHGHRIGIICMTKRSPVMMPDMEEPRSIWIKAAKIMGRNAENLMKEEGLSKTGRV
jgi:hypothetical protein